MSRLPRCLTVKRFEVVCEVRVSVQAQKHRPPGEPGHTVQTDDRKRTTRRHLDELTVRIDGQDIEDTVGGHMGSPVDGSKP